MVRYRLENANDKENNLTSNHTVSIDVPSIHMVFFILSYFCVAVVGQAILKPSDRIPQPLGHERSFNLLPMQDISVSRIVFSFIRQTYFLLVVRMERVVDVVFKAIHMMSFSIQELSYKKGT